MHSRSQPCFRTGCAVPRRSVGGRRTPPRGSIGWPAWAPGTSRGSGTRSPARGRWREGCWAWFDEDVIFVQPWGSDPASIRVPVHIWQGRHDRMVPYAHGEWLAAHVPSACPHLSDEHGHLTLLVDSMREIVHELVAAG